MSSEGDSAERLGAAATAGRVYPLLLLLLLLFATSSCAIKRTVTMPVSSKILAAKTATLDELLSSLANYTDKIAALSSATLRASYTLGKVESGILQTYRSAPGWIILKRPESIRLNIQNPVTKTTLFEVLSIGDPFSFWYPRENKLYAGRNSMKEIDLEGRPFTLRPIHIFEAILPQKIDLIEFRLSMEEDRDAATKYYVLSIIKDNGTPILHVCRRLWIDRSVLAVTRQEIYDDAGRILSDTSYSRLTPMGDLLLPLSIKMDRPVDGYSLDLEFKEWRVNPELPPNAFEFTPEGAQRVELKEKGRSE